MVSGLRRAAILDTIDEISRLTSSRQVSASLCRAVGQFGFTSLGINGLPPPGEGADPVILAETAPDGFREVYIGERFYLADHICAQARKTFDPFRYDQAPYAHSNASAHKRFMAALETYGLGRGLIVPFGRPAHMPACVWLAGENPDLDDDTNRVIVTVALFAASKAHALSRPHNAGMPTSQLTRRERDALQWIAAGKTSWEISAILGLSERTINTVIAGAMTKLDAVTRTQAVVNAIRLGEIEL
jgi:LuxR family quorum sensing-dependent transcriptional regulator